MALPLTRAALDKATCMAPGCDHAAHDGLTLRSVCHTRTPTWCEYKGGVLTVTCALCHRIVTQIAVQNDIGAVVLMLREQFDNVLVAEVHAYGGIPPLLPEEVGFRDAFAEFCEAILGART